MKKYPISAPVKITPTNYDIAVIEVVEKIWQIAPESDLFEHQKFEKKDILTNIGISHYHWPSMVSHQRHVSKKAAKQEEIVARLKAKYFVNPDFIWNYPNEPEMFLYASVLRDTGETYGKKYPGSAKLLRKALIKAETELDEAREMLIQKDKVISNLQEDIANLKLLVKKLKGG